MDETPSQALADAPRARPTDGPATTAALCWASRGAWCCCCETASRALSRASLQDRVIEDRGLREKRKGLTNAAHFVVGSVGAVDDGQLHQLLALQFVHSLGLK